MSFEMEEQVNPLERDHCLCVVLPGGLEKSATVHGSKAVMDLLVTLCGSYHLNPSDYTVEILSTNKNNISFKPNSPIGSLEAEKIVLKPRGMEEKIRRPYMPEASVRLLINYNKSHKAVVRVNPRVPLETLLPVVCDKCEFNVETTMLLRDCQSQEPLDMTKSLNDHGLREVFAKDTASKEASDHQHQPKTPEAAVTPTEVISQPPLQEPPKEKKQKENRGFFSLFRRRKKPEMKGPVSAPASPGLSKQVGVSMNAENASPCNTPPADMPKKRRAPQPPLGVSQSVPNNLSSCHLRGPQRSAESTLRSTKRRAPPPPCVNAHQELQALTEVKGTVDSLNTVEELRESDESESVNLSLSSSSSPHPSHPRPSLPSSRSSFAHLHDMADPYLPSFRGKDLSDARCALAKVLTSSVSKGTLVRRLRNSASFPKFSNGSFMPQRSSGDGGFCAELESVLTSHLPTEAEWEDPAQRKGMTTFKVIPLRKETLHDPELAVDVPDQTTGEDNPESEAPPEVRENQTETEEDPRSPDRSETGTSLQSPQPSSQEIQASEELSSPLPPPDLDSQDCPGSPRSEAEDTAEEQKEEDDPEVTSEVIQAATSDYSEAEVPSDSPVNSEEQSESPQSPSRQSLNTETDHCDSCTDGREEEEEMIQGGEVEEEVEEEEEVIQGGKVEEEVEEEKEVIQGGKVEEEVEEEAIKGGEVEEEVEEEEEVIQGGKVEEEVEEEMIQGEEVKEEVEEEKEVIRGGEVEEDVEEEVEEDSFPPPPPPVFFNEDIEVEEEGTKHTTASFLPSAQPQSSTCNGQTDALSSSSTPDQSTAAPKPLDKMSSAPSRFAQAVALAVQKSRLQRLKSLGLQANDSPQSTLPSPPRSIYQYGA